MNDENKVWEFKDGTKVTCDSSTTPENPDYLYTPPTGRSKLPVGIDDPFSRPVGIDKYMYYSGTCLSGLPQYKK